MKNDLRYGCGFHTPKNTKMLFSSKIGSSEIPYLLQMFIIHNVFNMTPIIITFSFNSFQTRQKNSGTDLGTGYGGTVCGFHTRPYN